MHVRSPTARQALATRHTPDWHDTPAPAQQSVSSAQLCPTARQVQVCELKSQSICPQHSSEVAQVALARWQQRVVTGVGRQSKSPQHSAAEAHVEPGATQASHVPPLH